MNDLIGNLEEIKKVLDITYSKEEIEKKYNEEKNLSNYSNIILQVLIDNSRCVSYDSEGTDFNGIGMIDEYIEILKNISTLIKPIYNDLGKVMKGPNYFKPDLSKFIK